MSVGGIKTSTAVLALLLFGCGGPDEVATSTDSVLPRPGDDGCPDCLWGLKIVPVDTVEDFTVGAGVFEPFDNPANATESGPLFSLGTRDGPGQLVLHTQRHFKNVYGAELGIAANLQRGESFEVEVGDGRKWTSLGIFGEQTYNLWLDIGRYGATDRYTDVRITAVEGLDSNGDSGPDIDAVWVVIDSR